MSESWHTSRQVQERIWVTGKLILDAPAHLGNGDAEGLTDIPLLRDPLEQKPLLTGASIAGALRNYLRETERGYGFAEEHTGKLLAEQLFGHLRGVEATVQSWLMVDDALGTTPGIELRDGVALDSQTRTAQDHKKFDVELLQAGTVFDLSFELWLTEKTTGLLQALAVALAGLQQGEIGLGHRKQRGYGQCHAEQWQVRCYKVTDPKGLLAWLKNDMAPVTTGNDIRQLLGVATGQPDAREMLELKAQFALDSSLLIRSGSGTGASPDMVHLRSPRGKDAVPILSGTSLAGALRARALRIANTVHPGNGPALVDAMFGARIESSKTKPTGSRVRVQEQVLHNTLDNLVQTRVAIDRFTGGAYPQALFSEQPVWSRGDLEAVSICVQLRKFADDFPAQIGLLLLVLKDLWTGDLPLGGESSVGRGRLKGLSATITLGTQKWVLMAQGTEDVMVENATELEKFVNAFHAWQPKPGEVQHG